MAIPTREPKSFFPKSPARTRDQPALAPPSVRQAISRTGSPLDPQTRARAETQFHSDFSQVRVHTDASAARSAHDVFARAYTVGQHVVFGAGNYRPQTPEGFKLLTHELTHTLQQPRAGLSDRLAIGDPGHPAEREASAAAHGLPTPISAVSPRVQRQVAAPTQAAPVVAGRSASDLMADPMYLDNHLKSIQFYEARLAVLHYSDGSTLKLGLVPELIKSPIEAIDYRTLRSSHVPLFGGDPEKLRFLPRGKEAVDQMKDSAPFGQVLQFARDITFKLDSVSGRIVPTEVNSLSAPVLCQVLREAEAEFVKNFDALAAGGKLVFEKLKTIVELLTFAETAGAGKLPSTASKSAAAGAAAAAQTETTLTRKFLELLAKKVPGQVEAGGVAFGDIEVALEGTELLVRRSFVQNVSRIPGQGKLVQVLWEKAAIEAAKQAGAKSVQIAMRVLQNPAWKAYLESQGYTWQVLDKLHGVFGVEGALVKVITL